MEAVNTYQTYTNKTIKDIECIEIQLGKQKKKRYKESSLFFSVMSFKVLEKTFWNNFREYSANSTLKIHTDEWTKIVRGLRKLGKLLNEASPSDELVELLAIKSFEIDNYKSNFVSTNKDIDTMVSNFISWIEPELSKNSYITITV